MTSAVSLPLKSRRLLGLLESANVQPLLPDPSQRNPSSPILKPLLPIGLYSSLVLLDPTFFSLRDSRLERKACRSVRHSPSGSPSLSFTDRSSFCMQYLSRAYQYYSGINPATLTGAIDVIVVEREGEVSPIFLSLLELLPLPNGFIPSD